MDDENVLLNVFQYLSFSDSLAVRLISKSFKNICDLRLKIDRKSLTLKYQESIEKIDFLSKFYLNIHSIDLIDVSLEVADLLSYLKERFPRIRHLGIHRQRDVNDGNIHLIADCFPSLKSLTLSTLDVKLNLSPILKALRNLQRLKLDKIYNIYSQSFSVLKDVQILEIRHVRFTTSQYEDMLQVDLAKKLVKLSLVFCVEESQKVWKSIGEQMSNLEELEFKTADSLEYIALNNCKFLRRLTLHAKQCKSTFPFSTMNSVKQLDLSLFIASDDDLAMILASFPSLQNLTFHKYLETRISKQTCEVVSLLNYLNSFSFVKHDFCLTNSCSEWIQFLEASNSCRNFCIDARCMTRKECILVLDAFVRMTSRTKYLLNLVFITIRRLKIKKLELPKNLKIEFYHYCQDEDSDDFNEI
ncbi:hypothetical protein B4U79_17827 [Dinothrombium tinctorium]|uniref:F-box domain-containing protein n=1 Tax=Dinothrombium tinctorium TaxID=1965070 RepID=A0A443RRU4_9ACAR|nr:hypothetical protein B4U79_17827 [Dinothrombium tinctorium]